MALTLSPEAVGMKELQEGLKQALKEHAAALNTLPAKLRNSIVHGTVTLEELDAFFREAPNLPSYWGQVFLRAVLRAESKVALVLGLLGILTQDPGAMQKGVDEYNGVLDRARANGMEDGVTKLPLPTDTTDMMFGDLRKAAEETYANAGLPFTPDALERVYQQLQDALEELDLAVRLLSIKDPFEGWRALTKEISKVWPKDVSAVDAIREQRE